MAPAVIRRLVGAKADTMMHELLWKTGHCKAGDVGTSAAGVTS